MVIVFGSVNLDFVTQLARLPGAGETVIGDGYATHPGGKGANQALAARRAGAEVAMIGAVGRDGVADAALALLAGGGVDLAGVARVDAPTGAAFIAVDAAGENQIVVAAGANRAADPAALADLGKPGDILVLQREVPDAALVEAARLARARGLTILLNNAPAAPLPPGLPAHLDWLIVNETEAGLLLEETELAPADRPAALRQALGVATIVTLGRDGVVAAPKGGPVIALPAMAVAVVDTVGAGDTFCGAFAAALGRGDALPEALAYAGAAASLACTRPGAQPSLPTHAEITRALGG